MRNLTTLGGACAAGLLVVLAGCAAPASQGGGAGQQTAAAGTPTTGAIPNTTGAGANTMRSGALPDTRDWSQVDTNRDGLVSPQEMAAYLQANPGPLKGK